ncbi:RNA-binding protein RO60-like [Ruditapes philippinarum]|uniref:RNA-binding protein RO60-like n=1 Tax=Ruditapes philippinarum TaxID=129788 RepID=UPI00295BF012|nr:RNA-binding protein RO60-like [Ruditapes philippinarum]
MMSDLRCLDHFLWSDQSKGRHPSSENAKFIDKYIEAGKGKEVVKHITDLSLCGRTPRQNYLIFALAICAISKDHDTKKQAYEKLTTICRIPTHLFLFVSYCKQESLKRYQSKGWGRARRRAIINWYKNQAKDPESFARLLTKYKSKTRMVQTDGMAEQKTDENTIETKTDKKKKSTKTKKRPGKTKTEEQKMITKTKETTAETKNEESIQKIEKENNTEDKKADITEEKKPEEKTNTCDTNAIVKANETKTNEKTNKAKAENKGAGTIDNSQETRTGQKEAESKIIITTEDSMTKGTKQKEKKTEEKTEKTRTEVTTQEPKKEENTEKIKKEITKTKQNTGKTTQDTKRDKANDIKKGEKTEKAKSKDKIEQTKIDESTQETKQNKITERTDTKKTKTKESENEMEIDAEIKNTLEDKKKIKKTEESWTEATHIEESLAERMKREKTKTDEIKIETNLDKTKTEEKKMEKTKTVEKGRKTNSGKKTGKRKEKWSHAKLFKMARPKFKDDDDMKVVKQYILFGFEKANTFARDHEIHSEFISKFLSFIEVAEKAKRCTEKDQLVALIKKHKLEREHITTQMMKKPEVCEAIIVNMKVGAVIRNLTVMASKGIFDKKPEVIEKTTTIILNKNALINERVHPINIIIALHMYEKGTNEIKTEKDKIEKDGHDSTKATHKQHINTGQSAASSAGPQTKTEKEKRLSTNVEYRKWEVNARIKEALNLAFSRHITDAVKATDKRFLLAISKSKDMLKNCRGCPAMTCQHVAAAMIMLTINVENHFKIVAFSGENETTEEIDISNNEKKSLNDICEKIEKIETNGSEADPSVPIRWANKKKKKIDVFILYAGYLKTDWHRTTETTLKKYRKVKPNARVIVIGMLRNDTSSAVEKENRFIRYIVGFDKKVPMLIQEFVQEDL